MQLGFTTFTCPQWSLDQVLQAARGYGYHGVEIRCDARHEHGVEVSATPEARQRMRDEFATRGVEACCLATSIQLLGDHAIELLEGRLKLAADLGFKAVRLYCGRPAVDQPVSESLEQAGVQLKLAERLARQYAVELWLETHGLAARAEQAVKICQQVESELVGVLYDTLAPARAGETIEQTFIALGRQIRHVHFQDGKLNPDRLIVTPLGQGQLQLDTIFGLLVNAGYQGYLCGQWFNDQYGHGSDESLSQFHQDIIRLAKRHDVEIQPPMR